MRLVRLLLPALVVLTLAGGVAEAGGPPDPFRGAWTSVDAADGSDQTLHFGGGGSTRRASLRDRFASSCPLPPQGAVAKGEGVITSPATIEVTFTVRCQRTGDTTVAEVTFTHEPASNTLTDDLAPPTTWFRPGS